MSRVLLPTNIMRAAMVCAAKKDVRRYLNGVHVVYKDVVYKEGTLVIESSNGKVGFRHVEINVFCAEPFDVVIPNDALNEALKIAGRSAHMRLTVEPAGCRISEILFESLNGFPDMARVIPSRTNHDGVFQYDAELLAQCQKAMRIATGRKKGFFTLQHGKVGLMYGRDGENSICFTQSLGDCFF